ncbi:UDP-2,4-diacetamido-2,4,6-trideoxy-beta-L-altropyranose hydrolase [Candidatus Beckwithbacteria bacterium CG10_big_fil_rev_8_21_14_0_10_34_10]|uniref:UDP-2,4-diacetamido-2,4, 6-trideoxy-beta-L-altropyranose hydrolase n=1 Tax=Candidatus Beckwithbacteria bacterium CG10_big_fil_rev_8_21_14_0_10_34_10 TaxID=1974495 RepID=A0A2H0W977_9BACT|nr:MAG: UDP-2,4-diacetamido-2,4,6-trideoxy-beta-L-altropyranose hydrolase [Candidatus Beckwithbacteria bacterium CG10_big_fil_rev_8_21_14_0_10_34_10]
MKIFLLTEAGKNIGSGHITRCIALSQAFIEKGLYPYFVINGDNSVKDLFKDKKYIIFNWLEERKRLFNLIKTSDIVIIDSYLADNTLYKGISENAKLCVYIDDNKRIDYPKGILVNGGIYSLKLKYPKKRNLIYLLGFQYTILRKEFWYVGKKKVKKNIKDVMITFGGADTKNITTKVLRLLTNEFPNFNKKVVIGKWFRNFNLIKKQKDERTEFIEWADANKMKELMMKSDIVVSAGGQALFEFAQVGLPVIIIAANDKNQLKNINEWKKTGFIEYAGLWKDKNLENSLLNKINFVNNYNTRLQMSYNGKRILKKNGSLNVVSKILQELTNKE